MKQSLGFVECDGLSSAVVAADKMLKTAAVKLEGMHETMGIGWVTVKIGGDLSAVQAAVDEVKATMPKIVMGSVVLGMPAEGIDQLGQTDIGIFLPKPPKKPTPPQNGAAAPKEEAEKSNPDETIDASTANKKPQNSGNSVSLKTGSPSPKKKESSDKNESLKENETAKKSDSQAHKNAKIKAEAKKDDSSSNDDKQVVTCNLCGDPKCPRKMGEPHKKCIHYNELKNKKNSRRK